MFAFIPDSHQYHQHHQHHSQVYPRMQHVVPSCSYQHQLAAPVYDMDDLYEVLSLQRQQEQYAAERRRQQELYLAERRRQQAIALYQAQREEEERQRAIALRRRQIAIAKAQAQQQQRRQAYREWLQEQYLRQHEPSYSYEVTFYTSPEDDETQQDQEAHPQESMQVDKPAEQTPDQLQDNVQISTDATSDDEQRNHAAAIIQHFFVTKKTMKQLQKLNEQLASVQLRLQSEQLSQQTLVSAEEQALQILDGVDSLRTGDSYDEQHRFTKNPVRSYRRQIVREVEKLLSEIDEKKAALQSASSEQVDEAEHQRRSASPSPATPYNLVSTSESTEPAPSQEVALDSSVSTAAADQESDTTISSDATPQLEEPEPEPEPVPEPKNDVDMDYVVVDQS